MRRIGKTEVTQVLMGCGLVALLLGGYMGLRTNIDELKNQTRTLESRLAAAEQGLKVLAQAPATQATEEVTPAQPGRAPTRAQIADTPSTSSSTTEPRTKSVAEAVADTVVCVDRNTHTQVPCERAASCLGLKSFDLAYFNGLRTKLGISSPMMICNMKSAESETPGVPSE